MSLDKSNAINIISKSLNIDFSPEQRAILNQPSNQALLVNACAGSGKTTLFISKVLVEELVGEQAANSVLGITFSKKAQLDMQKKFEKYNNELRRNNLEIMDTPTFQTFHSLFFHLLRLLPNYHNISVVDSWNKFYLQLASVFELDTDKTAKTKKEYLEDIFHTHDYLINHTLSLNGIDLNYSNSYVKAIANGKQCELKDVFYLLDLRTHEEEFIDNYKKVINKYHELKKESDQIDFNDMMVCLYEEMHDEENLTIIRREMSRFNKLYIDEFQDIDPLQWMIIKNIVKKDVLNKIFVVGDDDQSIYGFRGSETYYIINFANKLLPNAKVMNLSTNYRTGERILNAAIPMIQNNHSRLNKSLKAYNVDTGKIKILHCTYNFDKNPFLQNLIRKIKESNSNGQTIAILTRYNFDKMIIRDYLATKKLYLYSNKSLLQENKMYKTLVGLMKAIKEDNVKDFISLSNFVGFKKLQKYLKSVYKNYSVDKRTNGIQTFIKLALNQLPANKKDIKIKDIKNDLEDIINKLRFYYKNITYYSNNKSEVENFPFYELWNCVYLLTSFYYKYMIQNNFISGADYNSLIAYLEYLTKQNNSFEEFISKEQEKEQILNNKDSYAKNVELLTVHQSKGLEYNNIFLYGFTAKDLDGSLMKLSDTFSKNLTFKNFEDKINSLANKENPKLLHYLAIMGDANVTYSDSILEDLCPDYSSSYLIENLKEINYKEFLKSKNINKTEIYYDSLPLSTHDAQIMFHSLKTLCNAVEEERRILYVAITRAKNNCFIEARRNAIGDIASPLLKELAVSQPENENKDQVKNSNLNLRRPVSSVNKVSISSKKYYVVRNGRQPGIFRSWSEAEKQISGYPGARYRSFDNLRDAEEFLNKKSNFINSKGKTKFYAIRKGRKTGIFQASWNSIEKLVNGYPGARYKSFNNVIDAQIYMNK